MGFEGLYAMGCERLDQRVHRVVRLEHGVSPLERDEAHAGQPSEVPGRRGLLEGHAHATRREAALLGEVADGDDAALAQHRHAARELLHLGEDVRGEEDRAPLGDRLAQDRLDLLLYERVEGVCRLVQHQHVGLRHERDDEAGLLVVAARQVADAAVTVEPQPLDELLAVAPVDAPAQRRDEVEAGVDGERVVEGEVAGQVAAAPAYLDRVALGVEPPAPRRGRRWDGSGP